MSDDVFIEAEREAWRGWMRRFTFCAIVVITILASVLYRSWNDAVGLVMWLGLIGVGIGVSWRLMATDPNRNGFSRVILVLTAIAVGSVLGIGLARKAYLRARCGAYSLSMRTVVESLRDTGLSRFNQDGTLPPTVLALIADPDFDRSGTARAFDRWCGDFDTREIRVGSMTLRDVLRGHVTLDEVVQSGTTANSGLQGWEAFTTGGYLIDERAWSSKDPDLIVVWMVYEGTENNTSIYMGTTGVHYGYASVKWAKPDSLSEALDLNDDIAARLGVDPAPPELRAWCRD
ncbi:MAG: hypothetical protein R3B46_04855 [Phycisphaerales bacterium]|nr:hypothetical protein [Phycisphaerales bacterium]